MSKIQQSSQQQRPFQKQEQSKQPRGDFGSKRSSQQSGSQHKQGQQRSDERSSKF